MRRIVDVVTSGALPGPAQGAARRWHGASLAHVRSSMNHIFRLRLPDERIGYLRLTPVAYRRPDALAAEMTFIEQVATAGVAVARPIRSVTGAYIETIDDAPQGYHAAVFEALAGRQFTLEDMDEMQFRAWGRTLAHLHQASQALQSPLGRPSWESDVRAARASLPAGESAAASILDATLAWLRAHPAHGEEYGLIHGDAELDNIIWDGERPQLLDFDSSVYAPYGLDIAIALQDVWRAAGDMRDDRIAWFSAGYSEIRPLPANLREEAPQMQRALVAFKIARLLHAYAPGGLASPADTPEPMWLETLRARHRQWLADQHLALR